jgi:DNA polymerase-3 subunit alpha
LDITKIDPLFFNLYFERFLNPTRNSAPDLDIDYMSDTKGVTEDFLVNKYGKERVLHVSTFSTFNEKGCLKDVVRAHHGEEATGYDSGVFQVTKEMPVWSKVDYTLKDWFEQWPKEKECSSEVRKWLTNPENKKILNQTLKLQGQIRGVGQHAAGVVVTPSECWNDIPTNIIATNKSIVTAFSEADGSTKDLSELGILKLDMLSLETLNVIQDSIKIIKETKKIDITDEINYINLEDKNLYSELRLGLNHGVFQFESHGMNSLIKGVGVNNFDEMVAVNALYRPGPMGIKAHEDYVKNKFSPDGIKYIHPIFKDILKESNGVLIFQEQVMFIANKVGGMSLGEGDLLRRYMDKAAKMIDKESKGEELTKKEKNSFIYKNFEKYWNKFIQGAKQNGFEEGVIDEIKSWMIKYLGYSFNKCLTKNHSVISEERGKINILDVKIGERILGYNPEKHQDEFNVVKNVYNNGNKKVYRIKTKSGKVLECTLDHKVMTEYGMKTLREIIDKKLKIKIGNI